MAFRLCDPVLFVTRCMNRVASRVPSETGERRAALPTRLAWNSRSSLREPLDSCSPVVKRWSRDGSTAYLREHRGAPVCGLRAAEIPWHAFRSSQSAARVRTSAQSARAGAGRRRNSRLHKPRKPMATQIKTKKPRTFRLTAPGAHSVLLAGDFTHWQQSAIPMHRRDGGDWAATVTVTPGEHHYRFIVDGQWRDDPDCPLRVPNPFGGQDMIADVA